MGMSATAKIGFGYAWDESKYDSDIFPENMDYIIEEIEDKYPLIEIGYHGYDFENIFIAVERSIQTSWWGEVEKINSFTPTEEEIKQLELII